MENRKKEAAITAASAVLLLTNSERQGSVLRINRPLVLLLESKVFHEENTNAFWICKF